MVRKSRSVRRKKAKFYRKSLHKKGGATPKPDGLKSHIDIRFAKDEDGWKLPHDIPESYKQNITLIHPYTELPYKIDPGFQNTMKDTICSLVRSTNANYINKIITTETLYIYNDTTNIKAIDNDWIRIYMRLYSVIKNINTDHSANDPHNILHQYETGNDFVTIGKIIGEMVMRKLVMVHDNDIYNILEAFLDEELTHLNMFSMQEFNDDFKDPVFDKEKEKLTLILKYFNVTDKKCPLYNWRVFLEKKLSCNVAGDQPCNSTPISKFSVVSLCKLVIELHKHKLITMSNHMLNDHIYTNIIIKCYFIEYQTSPSLLGYIPLLNRITINPTYTKYNVRLRYNFGSGSRVEDALERRDLFLTPSYRKYDTIDAHVKYIEESEMIKKFGQYTLLKWKINYNKYYRMFDKHDRELYDKFDEYTFNQGYTCKVYSDQAYI
jgi:hypothetical protein